MIQPLYIEDMVRYLLAALQKDVTGTYVLAGPEAVSINDFIKMACTAHQKNRLFFTVPRAVLSLMASVGDAIGPSFGWGRAQFNNLYFSRTYPMNESEYVFGFSTQPLKTSLAKWALASRDRSF